MGKVLILGAGFSKAIADLPVTYQMLDAFREVQEKEKQKEHRNRVMQGNLIFEFWRNLREQFLLSIPFLKKDKLLDSNFEKSFESVLTFIDLNINSEVSARFEGEKGSYSFSKDHMFSNYDLKQVRMSIETYLYLALIDAQPNEALLNKFIEKFVAPDTTIITFNYDLILDKKLYATGKWYPHDGYGFAANVPELVADKLSVSDLKLLKLHGSLNWKEKHPIWNPFEFIWADDQGNLFFPGYLKEPDVPSFVYQGTHGEQYAWMLPSWIKGFHTPELLEVWRKASSALAAAEEIMVVGYSLPEQDAAAVTLLNSVDYSKKDFIIVDPRAKDYEEKYSRIVRGGKLIIEAVKLQDYL